MTPSEPIADIEWPVNLDELGFDPNALRAKYRAERDKRIRADGNQQYQPTEGSFSRYVEDPYIDQVMSRKPLFDECDVIVIGGGFGGMLAAARLQEAGVEKIRIIEKGGDFGGTWYWNRYPGAMCDIESYIYLPLLEEMNYVPKEKYTRAPEILAYSRRIAEHYGLYEHACLQTEATEVRWDESIARWIVSTDRGDRMTARFVAMSNGPLSKPKLPGIPGIDSYQGHTFHTSRWDYEYTGGSSEGDLGQLHDKRVAIIGTGATAIQCVPHLGATAKELYVFQRTPSSVDVRGNRPTEPEWAASLKPGWQQERMDNFNILVTGGYQKEDMVGDGWTEIYRNLAQIMPLEGAEKLSKVEVARLTEIADFQKMERVRSRVDSIVEDHETAEALKPYYRQFCKRPCYHDDYLATFNRPNVHLVDTQGAGVDRITQSGLVANGVEYEVDCIIFATGFEVSTGYTRNSGYEVFGRDGVALSKKWADGPSTFHGVHSHGFPNCYFMGMIQSALAANFPHLLNEQSKHIAHTVKTAIDRGAKLVEATEEAEQQWCETMRSKARMGMRFFSECTPGYYNSEGTPDANNGFFSNVYGGGAVEFFDILKAWREEGKLTGLRVEK
ncbi:MAG: cyclohexanone monooxygenase [Gammaproteobacteria bacterium]